MPSSTTTEVIAPALPGLALGLPWDRKLLLVEGVQGAIDEQVGAAQVPRRIEGRPDLVGREGAADPLVGAGDGLEIAALAHGALAGCLHDVVSLLLAEPRRQRH